MVDVPFVTAHGDHSIVVDALTRPGDFVRFTWTGVQKDRDCGVYGYATAAAQIGLGPGDTGEVRWPITTTSSNIGFVCKELASQLRFDAFTDGFCSTGQILGLSWAISPTEPSSCEYGTQVSATAPTALTITADLLESRLAALNLGYLLSVLGVFIGTTFLAHDICDHGVPATPIIDLSTAQASIDTARNILYWVLFPTLCECKPGVPAPTPPPLPGAPQPPGWPTGPTFPCDNVDPCAVLVDIQRQLLAISKTVGADLGLTTIVQRYHVPFGTIETTPTQTVSGAGSFALDRAVGIKVDLDSDGRGIELEGTPAYKYDAGWMSVSDGGAMLIEKRITRSSERWFPKDCQLATQFGFFLKDGVSAHFTPLHAEP